MTASELLSAIAEIMTSTGPPEYRARRIAELCRRNLWALGQINRLS